MVIYNGPHIAIDPFSMLAVAANNHGSILSPHCMRGYSRSIPNGICSTALLQIIPTGLNVDNPE